MKSSRIFLPLLMSCLIHPAFADSLGKQIESLIQTKLPHATVAIVIQDPDKDQIIYEREGEKLLNPASNIKVFTATAALYQLGLDYQYKTTLFKKDNDYYLQFTGAPSLTMADLDKLIQQLPKSINGNLILDNSRFQPPYHASGVTYDDLGWYYEAPSTAFILDDNKATYYLVSPKKLGDPITVKPHDNANALHLINELKSVNAYQAKHHCSMNINIEDHNTLRLYGCLPQQKQEKYIQLAIPDPLFYGIRVIKDLMTKNEIKLEGKIQEGRVPADAETVYSLASKPLPALLAHMLEESDNLYADSLTKTLGYALTREGSYKQGAYAIKHILKQNTKIDTKQLVLADGQGTRYNLITARQMVELLNNLYHHQAFQDFMLNGLAKMGETGTLKGRMKNSPLAKQVMAKTGTMHDISALSGYLKKANGKILIFSIIINGVNENILVAKDLEDQILTLINKS